MPKPVSTEIIKKAANGDQLAFRQIVESHQGFVYALAYRMVGNAEDAEDITQDAFVRLWKHLPKYRSGVKVSTWLYEITTNLSLDLLKSAHHRLGRTRIEEDNASHVIDVVSAESMVERQELSEYIKAATDALPALQKAVFVLRHLQMLSAEETCQALSMTADQVKAHLCLARKSVARTIDLIYRIQKKEGL